MNYFFELVDKVSLFDTNDFFFRTFASKYVFNSTQNLNRKRHLAPNFPSRKAFK